MVRPTFAGSSLYPSKNQLVKSLSGYYSTGLRSYRNLVPCFEANTCCTYLATGIPGKVMWFTFGRDGVSEGQFYQVLLHELDAIRKVPFFTFFFFWETRVWLNGCCDLVVDVLYLM